MSNRKPSFLGGKAKPCSSLRGALKFAIYNLEHPMILQKMGGLNR